MEVTEGLTKLGTVQEPSWCSGASRESGSGSPCSPPSSSTPSREMFLLATKTTSDTVSGPLAFYLRLLQTCRSQFLEQILTMMASSFQLVCGQFQGIQITLEKFCFGLDSIFQVPVYSEELSTCQ